MDYDRIVASSPLNGRHLTGDSGQVRAAAIRTPVSHVQLNHLVGTACLWWYTKYSLWDNGCLDKCALCLHIFLYSMHVHLHHEFL